MINIKNKRWKKAIVPTLLVFLAIFLVVILEGKGEMCFYPGLVYGKGDK